MPKKSPAGPAGARRDGEIADRSAIPKDGLHPRNRHRGRYDFPRLIAASPELARCVAPNAHGDDSIDFADPAAVKALNRALLVADYGIVGWDIPDGYLCPPIPGRVDYLHRLADLLAEANGGVVPGGPGIRVLDVGCGANCIYPLLGHAEYGWQFVGSDIDPPALAAAQATLAANPGSQAAIELRRQGTASAVFAGIIGSTERFALTLCNPPFHASLDAARAGSSRKWQKLGKAGHGKAKGGTPQLNFGGRAAELCCPGGEAGFIGRMVAESPRFAGQCLWFSSLVARADSLPAIERALAAAGVDERRIIDMAQGQKRSRIVAWSFIERHRRAAWLAGT